MKKKRLGQVLHERGHISADDLTQALEEQQNKMIRLGELLLQRRLVSKPDLAAAVAEISAAEYVDCQELQPTAAVLKLIPAALARRCRTIPMSVEGKTLTVVMSEPQNIQILDELRFQTGLNIVAKFAFQGDIAQALERVYAAAEAPAEALPPAHDTAGMEFISSSTQQRNIDAMREMELELRQKSKTTPAVQLVAAMIKAAVSRGASDIHIEPQQNDTAVRFRVDGILRDYQRIPRTLQNTVASRVKILSDMDIAERRNPQDGRFLVKIMGQRIDLRVSTLPTQYGEKVVMRLLEADLPLQGFADLGVPAELANALGEIIRLPQGMLLVTGPTGSGKSTTLYACLHQIRRPAVNVVTVEDPVEYELPGLNQVQVNVKAGLTFASCLRSVLRQDPDVVMVGEIRDVETAEIAMKAAQTGHFVLSTLHTNDSISAVTRLLDLGVPGYQVASALSAIIGQRLVRRLCSCHSSAKPSQEYVDRLMAAGSRKRPEVFHGANGCEMCDFTGYRGRLGIYEMLRLNEPLRQAIRSGGHYDQIRTLARGNGMKLMHEYALDLVCKGLTTLEEVQRVVAFSPAPEQTCDSCGQELCAEFVFCPFCGVKRRSPTRSKRPTGAREMVNT